MKIIHSLSAFIIAGSISFQVSAQTKKIETSAEQVVSPEHFTLFYNF